MGLINYEQLEDGFDASANLWNERFGILFNEINGNLDAANFKNNAVTTPKIAPGAVTSDKLDLDYDIDDNGWAYYSLGNFKYYVKAQNANTTSAGRLAQTNYRYAVADEVMPVGVTKDSTFWMSCTYTAGIQFILKPYWKNQTTLSTMAWNVGPDEFVVYTGYWMIVQRIS